MNDALANLARSPALYPAALDLTRDAVLLIGMEEGDYRASSFLDERISARDKRGQWVPAAEIRHAMSTPVSVRPLHFIFQAGHVGSTLLSRLIETGKALPLREPVPLRTMAEAFDMGAPDTEARLEMLLRLWERGFAGTEAVVLKATSSAERLAPKLLTMRPKARAVVLNVSAESYLATMLAASNSAVDLNNHGPERLHRLQKMGVSAPRPTTLGELVAMSWLAEKLTQVEILRTFGPRVLAVDFDTMLQSLEDTLGLVLDHFEIVRGPGDVAAIAASPAVTRYSKAPEQGYSTTLRLELLNEARARYPEEIRAALDWLAMTARRHESTAALL
jgi:hypothetical protein